VGFGFRDDLAGCCSDLITIASCMSGWLAVVNDSQNPPQNRLACCAALEDTGSWHLLLYLPHVVSHHGVRTCVCNHEHNCFCCTLSVAASPQSCE
jgi:hypothetical protein